MPRSDRLFDLIQILRDGQLHRAADLARALAVSERTIWRDMGTLMASGLAVEGERGVGYILRQPMTLPPMILTPPEREALRQGLRLVSEGRDEALARAARSLAAKISAVTPSPVEDPEDLFATPARATPRAVRHLPLLREAIRAGAALVVTCLDAEGFERDAWALPRKIEQDGKNLVLRAEGPGGAGLCFRIDRILALRPVDHAPGGSDAAGPSARNMAKRSSA
jgi:predicted DNA-binding transcriptional regulator YafY